jgi:DNA repair protein RadA/Sms
VLRGPSSDLAVAVAIASAATNVPVPSNTVVIGEVGLAGELRQVPSSWQRLSEAARLGFTRAVVPRDHREKRTHRELDTLQVVECADLFRALAILNVVGEGGVRLPADLRLG